MAQTKTTTRTEASELHWDLSKLAGRDLMDVWLDIGNEFSRFFAERIREDVTTQHRILHCHSPSELQQIQAEFLQKAVKDYNAETGRLIELSRKLGSNGADKDD